MKENESGCGLELASTLTLMFIVLKIFKVIDWSWWWVFSPLWIDFIVIILIVFICAIIDFMNGR